MLDTFLCSFILLFELINRINNKHRSTYLKKYILRHFFDKIFFVYSSGKSKIKMRTPDTNAIIMTIQLNLRNMDKLLLVKN